METEKARKESLARMFTSSADLQAELDRLVQILRYQIDCLSNELVQGQGYKQNELDNDIVNKVSKITTAFEKAVGSKVRLDKHLKDKAEEMSPEEEQESVIDYLKRLESPIRRKILINLLEYHNANCVNSSWFIKAS
jgi:maleate cis-trans isomerase